MKFQRIISDNFALIQRLTVSFMSGFCAQISMFILLIWINLKLTNNLYLVRSVTSQFTIYSQFLSGFSNRIKLCYIFH